MDIIREFRKIQFDNITVGKPKRLNGGEYFANIYLKDKPFYIQTPQCCSNNGIIYNSTKPYCDLIFNNDCEDFIQIIKNVEEQIKQDLFKNNDKWFETKLELEDINYFFNSNIKPYNDKYLFRTFITNNKDITHTQNIQIYDVNEENVDHKHVIDHDLVTIIHIKGVRFTNSSFYMDIDIKQILTLERNRNVETKIEIPDKETLELNDDIGSIDEYKGDSEVSNEDYENYDNDDNDDSASIDLETLSIDNDTIKIKEPSDIYNDLYKKAKDKAKEAKKQAVIAYLEAKNIKNAYMIDDCSSTDSSDLDNLSELSFEDLGQ
tara:strand:- start:557 stop:1516 length:960 start_codon:yes stop_codon:yes gene_type:complete